MDAIIIEFYKTTDDPKKIDKAMSQIGSGQTTLAATINNLADSITLLSPVFIVKSNNLYFTATHIKCAAMGNRWYFINDIVLLTGGKMQINCSIDVLKTYAASIITCPACITRAELGSPTYIPDSKLPIRAADKKLEVSTFQNGFTPNFNSNNIIVSVY